MRREAGVERIGRQKEDERQVRRVDQEPLRGVLAEPCEDLGLRPRRPFGDPPQHHLHRLERHHGQDQGGEPGDADRFAGELAQTRHSGRFFTLRRHA
jgi:hypothetical protein